MRTTTYSAIERGVASIAGIDPDNVLAHEKSILAEYINDAVNYCWDYYPWGEFTITEKRYFRDVWSSSTPYQLGSEVYHAGKFYRMHGDGNSNTEPSELLDWYEIGDRTEDSPWSEDGLYGIGARVSHNDKSYVCIALSPLGKTNFLTDGIEVTNTTYFQEVDTFFERYIPYEQYGYNTIGNCLGCYTNDPRYSNTKHLNFREGREGVYLEAIDSVVNEIWMVYKIEAPTFTPTSTDSSIPRFLAQAIKAHAYQSWLVGEGQHEKAGLQELKILDLLVRETDKIDLQANKNKPFSISPNSSELINARQSQITEPTPHLIGRLVEAESDLTFKLSSLVQGRNPYVKSTLDLYFSLETEIEAQDILDPRRKYGTTTCHSNLRVPAINSEALKTKSVEVITSTIDVQLSGFDAGQASSVDPISITISVAPPFGNYVYSNEADSSFGLNVAPVIVERLFANRVNINMGLSVQAQYEMPVFIEQRKQEWFNSKTSTSGRYFALGRSRAIDLTDTNTQLGLGDHRITMKFESLGSHGSMLANDDPLSANQTPFMTSASTSMQNGSGTEIYIGNYPITLFLLNTIDMRGGINASVELNGQSLTPFYQTPENNTMTPNGYPIPIISFSDHHRQSIFGVTETTNGGGGQYTNFEPLPYAPQYSQFTQTKAYWGGTIYKLYPQYNSTGSNQTNQIDITINTIANSNKVHVAMGFLPEVNTDKNQPAQVAGSLGVALSKAYQILDLDSVTIENL
tara:strand:+ start:2893 stop:5121 length:2229 start_codon:yes stop_codon:yes gene_type:complete